MINYLWVFMIIVGIVYGTLTGKIGTVNMQTLTSANYAVTLIIGSSYFIVFVAVAILVNIICPKENEEIQEVLDEKEECTLQDAKEIIR